MTNTTTKLQIIEELLELSERAFLYKLKSKNPDITEEEQKKLLKDWYHDRPGAEDGDGVGVKGDPARFNR
jgi:hypothetical protein